MCTIEYHYPRLKVEMMNNFIDLLFTMVDAYAVHSLLGACFLHFGFIDLK